MNVNQLVKYFQQKQKHFEKGRGAARERMERMRGGRGKG